MNSKTYTLEYDSNCPVCRSFAKLLSKHLKESRLILKPLTEDCDEFKLYSSAGEKWQGKEAIDELTKEFPDVKSFFWMLPPNYRKAAVEKTWKIGRWFRKFLRPKKDCNCSSKKKLIASQQ